MQNADGCDSCADDAIIKKEKARADVADYADSVLPHAFRSSPATISMMCSMEGPRGRASAVGGVLVKGRVDAEIRAGKMANF